MWSQSLLDSLAAAIVGLKADSRIVVVDHANVGDVCEWMCDEFALIGTLYSNQQITRDKDQTAFRSPRDQWYSDRVKRLKAERCRPTSLEAAKFLERFGGRRFDVVVSRHQFDNDDEAREWYERWLPVTTGRVCMVVGDEFRAIDGTCKIPERTPPVRGAGINDENPVDDINNLPKYKRRGS